MVDNAQWHAIGENWFTISQQVSISSGFLVTELDFVPTFPAQCWDLIWLEPVWVLCMLSQSEFLCGAPALSCLEDTIFSESSIFLPTLNIDPWVLRRESFDKDVLLRPKCYKAQFNLFSFVIGQGFISEHTLPPTPPSGLINPVF